MSLITLIATYPRRQSVNPVHKARLRIALWGTEIDDRFEKHSWTVTRHFGEIVNFKEYPSHDPSHESSKCTLLCKEII